MAIGSDSNHEPAAGGEALQGWVTSFRRLFDPHPAHVALLELSGTVLAVNAAWTQYAAAHGLPAAYDFVGRNYLEACEAGVAVEYPGAREAYVGLLDVLRNGRPKFTVVYACHTPARREWYRMWVEPQTPAVPVVIVAHQLISTEPWAPGEAAAEGGPTIARPGGKLGRVDSRRGDDGRWAAR